MERKVQCYRFVVGDVGIYDAVLRDCPKGDPRRAGKPDGAWLPRIGDRFPGATSFWTEEGLQRYRSSGLLGWHRSVVRGVIEVITIEYPSMVLYEDTFQVICDVTVSHYGNRVSLAHWERAA